jgi:hypothetical protein
VTTHGPPVGRDRRPERRFARRSRWPPPQPIDPAARISAIVTAVCLLGAGAATIAFAWDELTCTRLVTPGPERSAPESICDVLSGIGGVVTLIGATLAIGGLVTLAALRGRQVTDGGHRGWRWALAATFAVGALILITRIPSATCATSDATPYSGMCIDDEGGGRYAAASWTWAKTLATVVTPVLAAGIVARRELIWLSVPLTLVAWFVGVGWLLVDTIG